MMSSKQHVSVKIFDEMIIGLLRHPSRTHKATITRDTYHKMIIAILSVAGQKMFHENSIISTFKQYSLNKKHFGKFFFFLCFGLFLNRSFLYCGCVDFESPTHETLLQQYEKLNDITKNKKETVALQNTKTSLEKNLSTSQSLHDFPSSLDSAIDDLQQIIDFHDNEKMGIINKTYDLLKTPKKKKN